MPRLPKPPGSNPPAPIDELIEAATAAAAPRMEVDLLAALVAAGHDDAAQTLVDEQGRYAPHRAVLLAWMSWCTHDAERKAAWADESRQLWEQALGGGRDLSERQLALGWSAAALLADDPDDAIERALAPEVTSDYRLEPVYALCALGRLEQAVDVLEQRGDAVRTGVGWSTGVMERYNAAFIDHILERLVADRRWELLGRVCAHSEAHDGAFLSSICLSQALAGREDAADALAVLSPSYLRKCFLHTVSRMPEDARSSVAPLVADLPAHRRAIGEVLFGDPDLADGLLSADDDSGRAWDPLIVAMLRDDRGTLDAVARWDEWALTRTAVGGIRALSVRGDREAMGRWVGYLHDKSAECRDKDRPHILAQMGRELYMVGYRALGEQLLMEAFGTANDLERSSDQGWSRNNALERVGINAARAGCWQAALKSLQKCTGKYNRAKIAIQMSTLYARMGDFGGAARVLSFIKPDQTVEGYRAGLRLIEATIPGWMGRFNVGSSAA